MTTYGWREVCDTVKCRRWPTARVREYMGERRYTVKELLEFACPATDILWVIHSLSALPEEVLAVALAEFGQPRSEWEVSSNTHWPIWRYVLGGQFLSGGAGNSIKNTNRAEGVRDYLYAQLCAAEE